MCAVAPVWGRVVRHEMVETKLRLRRPLPGPFDPVHGNEVMARALVLHVTKAVPEPVEAVPPDLIAQVGLADHGRHFNSLIAPMWGGAVVRQPGRAFDAAAP